MNKKSSTQVESQSSSTGSTPNLLVIGSVAFDDIETPFGKAKKTLGGSATYISLSASYFARPALVGIVGEDFEKEHCQILQKKNVDLMGLEMKKGKTFAWGGKYHFDLNTRDTLFTHLNVFENFSPVLSPVHRAAKYVFLGNTHPAQQIKIINQLKNPKFVGLDTMNYWIEKTPKELGQVLKLVDALVINDSEARELSKEHNLLKAAKKISGLMHAGKKRLLIIKRGEYGLLLFQGGQIFHLPGFPLEDVVDPTGAGDTFAGGFMGQLVQIRNLSWTNMKKAALSGSVMASFCVEDFGTKKLQTLNPNMILKRQKAFKALTHFEA